MNRTTDIAIFVPALEGGGAERVVLNLIDGLCAKGLAVDLVLAQFEGELVDQAPSSARLITLSGMHLPMGRTFAALPLLARYLRKERPTALLTISDRANIVGVAARWLSGTNTRTVITVHRLFSDESSGLRRIYLKAIRRLAQRTYSQADAIVAVSRGAAKTAAKMVGIAESKIEVIYNPVLSATLWEKAREAPQHPWFDAGQPPVIVSVGRLEPPKDFETLLRAFALLRRRRAARLLILGDGPRRQQLTALIGRLGIANDVEMPGFVQNPYRFMARSAAVVLASMSEALPTVLIEALYLKRAVIATDCPTGPREILQDGAYGTLVPLNDAENMASALENALEHRGPEPDPSSWGRFTLESATERYIDILLPSGCASHTHITRPNRLATA